MTTPLYVDTSVALKLVFTETDSSAWRGVLADRVNQGQILVSSVLLKTEMRRIAFRLTGDHRAADEAMASLTLIALTADHLDAASLIPTHCKALDALHLATALGLDDPRLTVATADAQMRRAALDLGLGVIPPP